MRGRIGELLKRIFVQGTSPHELALTLALGIVVGCLPLVWGSTLICALLALRLGLNQPGIQAANYLAYPLQIALFVPFYRMGATIFPWGPSVSAQLLAQGLKRDVRGNVALLAVSIVKAVAAWLLVAPPVALLLYVVLRVAFSRTPALNRDAGTGLAASE